MGEINMVEYKECHFGAGDLNVKLLELARCGVCR